MTVFGVPHIFEKSYSETDYIQLSIPLAKDAKWRQHWQHKIQQKMQQYPGFIDHYAYGKKMGTMFSFILT